MILVEEIISYYILSKKYKDTNMGDDNSKKIFIPVKFVNKGVDLLKLSTLFHDNNVKKIIG